MTHIAMWARTSLFRRFTDANVYTEAVPLKNAPQNIRGYTEYSTAYTTRLKHRRRSYSDKLGLVSLTWLSQQLVVMI